MNIFVLAAGDASRFWGMPKQLLVLEEGTILSRIQEQLRVRGLFGTLVTHLPDLRLAWEQEPGTWPVLLPTGHRWIVETMLSTRWFWAEMDRTVILLGDTIYSQESMDRLLQSQDPLMFLGHRTELFGLTFSPVQHRTLALALSTEVLQAENGDIGKLQSLYWRLAGQPYASGRVEGLPYLEWVRDFTRDIDNPADYELLQAQVMIPGRLRGNL